MRFYLLDDPAHPAEFARFSHVGTWSVGSVCDACGEHDAHLVEPLQVEWDEGTAQVGDFSWCGYTAVVTDATRLTLERHEVECEFGDVEVMRPSSRAKQPRVPFPYVGPPLWWVRPRLRISVEEAASQLALRSNCQVCGVRRFAFKRDGLVLSESAWQGAHLFLIEQFARSGAMFVTESALELLAGLSNLAPRLAGTIRSI